MRDFWVLGNKKTLHKNMVVKKNEKKITTVCVCLCLKCFV